MFHKDLSRAKPMVMFVHPKALWLRLRLDFFQHDKKEEQLKTIALMLVIIMHKLNFIK